MTIKELYEYAKKNNILDYEIVAGYNDLGYQMCGGCVAEISSTDEEHKLICLRGTGEEYFDIS